MYELYSQYLNENSAKTENLLFTVTLIDDDPLFLEQMRDNLESMKITRIENFSSGEAFFSKLNANDSRLVICDYDFGSPGMMNGLQVLEKIKKINSELPVIIMSSQDDIAIALQVLRSGAMDYFIKGTENAFTSVLTSIIKINEIQRLKKNERDYQKIMTIGSLIAIAVIGFLIFQLMS